MKLEVGWTGQGLPHVAWIQLSPTGETNGSVELKLMIVTGIVLGFFGGYSYGGQEALFVGPLMGVWAALLINGHDQKQRGGPRPTDSEPVFEEQYCEATIERRGDELLFVWSMQGNRQKDRFECLLAETAEPIVGLYSEWHGDQVSRGQVAETFVIMLPVAGGRVIRIADHGGSRQEMAHLHGLLSSQLFEPRHEMLRALAEEVKQRALPPVGGDVPDQV